MTTQKGLVSVIIPNYNYAHFLPETIDSVLVQTYPNIEVIVVDDGSSDNSRAVLDGYTDRVQVIYQQNSGVSAARNNGAAASSGEFIAFLDADDVWMPTKIEKQIERFAAEPDLGLVHVGVVEVDDDGAPLLERLEGVEGDVTRDLLMLKREGVLGGGSGLMVPRAVFEEIGGFDPQLSTSADWDLFFQIAARHEVGFVPEILLRYRIHSSNMHSNVRVMESDMYRAFDKAFVAAPQAAQWRHMAYGILDQTLAASYLTNGKYMDFARTAIKGTVRYPRGIVSRLTGSKGKNRRGVAK